MDKQHWQTPELEENKWHDIVISKQKANMIKIKFDDDFELNEEISTAENYEKVKLFLSSPWFEPINGYAEIRDLQVRKDEPTGNLYL